MKLPPWNPPRRTHLAFENKQDAIWCGTKWQHQIHPLFLSNKPAKVTCWRCISRFSTWSRWSRDNTSGLFWKVTWSDKLRWYRLQPVRHPRRV